MKHEADFRVVRWLCIFAMLVLALSACEAEVAPESYVIVAVITNPTAVEAWDTIKVVMAEKGYVEGENTVYFDGLTFEQVIEKADTDDIDLIFTIGATFGRPVLEAILQNDTVVARKIPVIVAPAGGDPVATGYVESLSQPGGLVTGLLMDNVDAKRFEYFVNMVGTDEPIVVVYDPTHSDAMAQLSQIEAFAEQEDVALLLTATAPDDLQATVEALAALPDDVGGIFMLKIWGTSVDWFVWAYEHGVPTAQDGYLSAQVPQALMNYGPSIPDIGEDAAWLANQILKGTKPGDLPMEFPPLLLSIDLALSEAIGFEVPDATLRLADEIRRSDMAVYAGYTPPDPAGEVVHPAGTGACAATINSMAGANTICVSIPCEQLVDSQMVTYTDRVDVAECTSDQQVGTCVFPEFDMHYYDGDPGVLEIGCGFMQGEWILADS